VQKNNMKQSFLQTLHKYNMKSPSKSLSAYLGEPDRFDNFSAKDGGLLLDFSRVGIDQQSLNQLLNLAEECGLAEARKRLFSGQDITFT
jgi:glucose-6-phosphate isomerase